MQKSWIKNVSLILIILAIGIFAGYLIFGRNKTPENKAQENLNPNISSISKQEENLAKTNKEEPKALVPKKEANTPPPEPPLPEGTDRFIVSLSSTNENIAKNLKDNGYINDEESFISILQKEKNPISPGAYKISKEMTEVQLNKILHGKPYMKWIVIKEGLRKEEIAELLAQNLGWTSKQKSDWINKDTKTSPEYTEGVYYPDTYLIPTSEEPALVAKRLIAKFNEKFAPYLPLFTAKNIKWAKALTLASIVQREASNKSDMPLIAGILWNRLDQEMALGVDATLQYIRGNKGAGWWAPISLAEKQIDSPFNTYKYKGLPPYPISNPGISAIEAVLNPIKTDCLYYIHDKNRSTHCAVTYEEHQSNIQKYLIQQ